MSPPMFTCSLDKDMSCELMFPHVIYTVDTAACSGYVYADKAYIRVLHIIYDQPECVSGGL